MTQIPSILTHTTDWINFNCEANLDNKKLGHLSQKLDLGAGVDGPKHLPKYFDIWHNTEKLEKCVDQVYFVEKWGKRQEFKFKILRLKS